MYRILITFLCCSYVSRIPKGGGESERIGPKRFSRLNGIVAYSSSKLLNGRIT